jgi:hypothetical protein
VINLARYERVRAYFSVIGWLAHGGLPRRFGACILKTIHIRTAPVCATNSRGASHSIRDSGIEWHVFGTRADCTLLAFW